MTDPDSRQRVAAWIASMKGDRTGEAFAADVTATTGWNVDRSRLSKYANASIHIGRDVIAHMSDYAARKGFPPLDLNPPAPVLSLEERAVVAAERQADAAAEQTDLLRQILAAISPAAAAPPFSADEVEQLREMARTVRQRPADRPRTSTALPVVVQLR